MAKFENGEKVTWVEEMVCVPHPDGKTDRNGNILPVFRDKTVTGTIVNSLYDNKYTVRPNGTNTPKGMDSYYDKTVNGSKITKL